MAEPLVWLPSASGTMPGGDRGGRAARRAARRVPGLMRVARLAGREVRALGGHRLAHDHRAGGAEHRDHRRIARRRAAGVQDGAVLGRHVRGVDDVLDADRHAVQRAGGTSFAPVPVARPRLPERVLGIEELPGLHLLLDLAHAREAGLDQLLGADRAVADGARRVGGGEPVELGGVHRLQLP